MGEHRKTLSRGQSQVAAGSRHTPGGGFAQFLPSSSSASHITLVTQRARLAQVQPARLFREVDTETHDLVHQRHERITQDANHHESRHGRRASARELVPRAAVKQAAYLVRQRRSNPSPAAPFANNPTARTTPRSARRMHRRRADGSSSRCGPNKSSPAGSAAPRRIRSETPPTDRAAPRSRCSATAPPSNPRHSHAGSGRCLCHDRLDERRHHPADRRQQRVHRSDRPRLNTSATQCPPATPPTRTRSSPSTTPAKSRCPAR